MADQERVEREAEQRSQLELLQVAEAQRRQALSDLRALMHNARDFLRDALPDVTVTGDDAAWQVRLHQARLSIVQWPQPPERVDASD
jgi:hypothetical protein